MKEIRELKKVFGPAEAEARSRTAAEKFSNAAADSGLIAVAVGEVGSPLGTLLVAVTPRGLVRIAYPDESREATLQDLASAISPRILDSAAATEAVRRQLEQYFAGERTAFTVPIDWALIQGFARKTLRATAKVPYGELSTYGQIARRVGSPGAARAVGGALGSNPIPIVVPCHRVVRAGGELGGYSGGLDRKVKLLSIEGSR